MLTKRNYLTLLWMFTAVLLSPLAIAQDDAAAAATEEVAAETTTLWEMIQNGGWAMFPLGFLSICALMLIIYNFIVIRKKPFLVPDTTDKLREAMANLQLDEAKVLCEQNPAPVTNIMLAGLERVEGDNVDPEAMKDAMEEASSEELAGPFIMINYLSIVATLAPMVGLLGTVSGMVKAFQNIKQVGMGNPELLAGNISEALITTATGLTIAVPAMFFYSFFKNRYGKLVSSVTKTTGDLFFKMMTGIRRASGQ